MAAAERFEYVFGTTVGAEAWSDADENERVALVEKQFGARAEADLLVRSLVVAQIVAGEPPQMWATAQRLDTEGFDVDVVVSQLTLVVAQTMRDLIQQASEDDSPLDDDRRERAKTELLASLAARLDRLPIPSPGEVEDALVGVAADVTVVDQDELVARAVARFESWVGDPLFGHLAEDAFERLLEDDTGPLVVVPGDRVGHAERLRAGVMLTHVLSDAELELEVLVVSFDLAAFTRIPEPTFDGEPLGYASGEPGHLVWRGREGWLEPFSAGTTLAIRADADGEIRIDALPAAPTVEPDLVATLSASYQQALGDSELPVTVEELAFGILADDRHAFDEPRAPLAVLCEAAGLERRGTEVAHDPELWANQRELARVRRVVTAVRGDEYLADDVLAVLGLAEEASRGDEGSRVREALDVLDDLQVLLVVIDELFDSARWDENAGTAEALVQQLLAAARRPGERATARYLAALAAERSGDLAAAEQHLSLAVETGTDHVLALDRLAWYASDRGDAARALNLWKRCPPNRQVVADIVNVERFARAPKAEQGRNTPCWCGSGRKYKQCHLGVVEQAALPDRVGWLCRKAAGYLDRSDVAARTAVVEVVAARVLELDGEQIHRAMSDPLMTDLVLTEGGWFKRFFADRGTLLPDDEALLAASWATVDRSVYEVTDVTPKVGLTVRDLRTGDTYDVRERAFSTSAHVGMLICARAVPDGETHQLVGGVVPVAPGQEAEVLHLLDDGDPLAIAAWAGALERPPVLQTREGEALMGCTSQDA